MTKITRRIWAALTAIGLAGFLLFKAFAVTSIPTIDFLNGPLLGRAEPSNVALALSIEYPTMDKAYKESTYVDKLEYIGYYNSRKCYTYPGYPYTTRTTNTFQVSTDFFSSTGDTDANFYCNQAGTGTGFSGNYLNYATMTAPDIMRLALTGGDRGIDTSTQTVLDRGSIHPTLDYYQSPHRLASTLTSSLTPFSNPTLGSPTYALSCGDLVYFMRLSVTCPNVASVTKTFMLNPVAAVSTGPLVTQTVPLKSRVLVCDENERATRTLVVGDGDNYNFCRQYGTSTFKPIGQFQRYSDNMRVAVFSYLNEDVLERNGGVLRAPMKYVGANQFDSNGNSTPNPTQEWDPSTGIFINQPIIDSTSTSSYTYTGVVNYVNKFGKTSVRDGKDPVGELWYEALRYFQGLGPSPSAISGSATVQGISPIPESMKNGFPAYTSWTDPITNSCNRKNYILGIGDVNTWYDKSIPGITGFTGAVDGKREIDYPTAGSIKGTTTVLDPLKWTEIVGNFETNTPSSYTDSLGRSQTTTGNPSPNASLASLQTLNTGYRYSGYYWSGLAYWANTQPIRYDNDPTTTTSITPRSRSEVRVKTFMIDVDEGGNGSINNTGRSIPPRKSSFYLAGKYGYFNDTVQDGNPFLSTSGNATVDWATPETGTDPNGYVIASQAKKLIAGVKKFFSDTSKDSGSFSTVAVSANSFSATSQDGKKFEPSYIKGQWTGTIRSIALRLNTATFQLEDNGANWDAGQMLTMASISTGAITASFVKPDDRRIVTFLRPAASGSSAVSFTSAALGANLPASYSTVPYSTLTDTLKAERVNYIRGVRTKEYDGTFRLRTGILGDIINSGPTYKANPNPNITGAGYSAFYNNWKNREPMVYAGANDGMLHAFKASDGQELFAYIPGALLSKLPVLTSKNYQHDSFVDAVPEVQEAYVGSAWKTVLVSGMGGGAQGVFALDVTDPTNFSKANVMFEFSDKDDARMGNVVGTPKIVKMKVAGSNPVAFKYYVAVTSGYNNYKDDSSFFSDNAQALFFLSVDKAIGDAWVEGDSGNYYRIDLDAGVSTAANGLGQLGIRYGRLGEAEDMYAGDLQGNLWKFRFSDGLNTTEAAAAVKGTSGNKLPLAKFFEGSVAQPITAAPITYPAPSGGYMVVVGTGKYLDSSDINSVSQQSIYGVWDNGGDTNADYSLVRAKFQALTASSGAGGITVSGSTVTFTASGKRGWYFNLPLSKERVVIDSVAGTGYVTLSSSIPSDACGAGADGTLYVLSPSTGIPTTSITSSTNVGGDKGGLLGRSIIINIDVDPIDAWGTRATGGKRSATLKEAIYTQKQSSTAGGDGSAQIQKTIDINFLAAGRVYWREVRDFFGAAN
jgi:type IV pilus assembly protein PilY1